MTVLHLFQLHLQAILLSCVVQVLQHMMQRKIMHCTMVMHGCIRKKPRKALMLCMRIQGDRELYMSFLYSFSLDGNWPCRQVYTLLHCVRLNRACLMPNASITLSDLGVRVRHVHLAKQLPSRPGIRTADRSGKAHKMLQLVLQLNCSQTERQWSRSNIDKLICQAQCQTCCRTATHSM